MATYPVTGVEIHKKTYTRLRDIRGAFDSSGDCMKNIVVVDYTADGSKQSSFGFFAPQGNRVSITGDSSSRSGMLFEKNGKLMFDTK